MIKKIISGGQTGADQAALDVAIEIGIAHGGWIPKGRKTEAGRLSDKYQLSEIDSIDYEQRTELNVADSDGTIIFSHGDLTGGSAFTREMAWKHNKPCLHIDLNTLSEYKAVVIIRDWVQVRKIKILNVAGSRASHDPKIYDAVVDVLKSVLYPPPETITSKTPNPNTVEEVVDRLINTLHMKGKTNIANMDESELTLLYPTLGEYIRNEFGIWSGNEALLQDCRFRLKKYDINEDDVSRLIIRKLWKRLRDTHALRVVK